MDPNVKPHLRNLTLRYWLPASYSLWNRCPRIKDGRKDLVKKGLEGGGALLLQKGVQFSYAIILGIRFWYTTTLFDRSLKMARLPSFLALVFSWSFFKQKCAPSSRYQSTHFFFQQWLFRHLKTELSFNNHKNILNDLWQSGSFRLGWEIFSAVWLMFAHGSIFEWMSNFTRWHLTQLWNLPVFSQFLIVKFDKIAFCVITDN